MHSVVRWTLALAVAAAAVGSVPGDAAAQSGAPPKRIPLPAGAADDLPGGVKMPTSPTVPTTFDELFTARDTRAMAALEYMRCLQNTLRAVQRGVLGQVPRGWIMTCVEEKGEWRGVFSELIPDAPGVIVQAQFAIRNGRGMAVTDAIDTARVNGVSRALTRGVTAKLPGAGKHQFMPIPLPQPTFIELWFLPVPTAPTTAVVGGDSLIQMSADGARELGHSRSAPPIRTLSVTPGSQYVLKSTEERIPLLSELMVVHMALSLAPDVRVLTYQYESAFKRGVPDVTHVRR